MTDRARRLAKLSPAKRALLERQQEKLRREKQVARRESIPRVTSGAGPHALSSSQERFWFLQQLEPTSSEYNVVAAGRFLGTLHPESLRRALAEVVRRHAILRTRFEAVDGLPQQIIEAQAHIELPCLDLSRRGTDKEREAEDAARSFCARPFDLAEGPLLRAQLIKLAPEEHLLIVLQHHIVCDGWSLGVLSREIATCYSAHVRRVAPELDEPALQFTDWARFERERLRGEHLERELAFWRERLDGAPSTLELPLDRPRPALQTHAGRTLRDGLGSELSREIRRLASANGSTLYLTMLSAFSALLSRLCGQSDVVVGTSIANRDRPEVAELLGPLMNTIALRVDTSGPVSFVELLARCRSVSAEAFAHPELPFERVVEALGVERDPSRSPVFNVFFDMEVTVDEPSYAGLEVQPYSFDHQRAMFDLALSIADDEREIQGALEFNTDLFDRATIDRIWESFRVLLRGLVDAPERPLHELSLLTDTERSRILHDFNATELSVEPGSFVHLRFERCAAQTPEAAALEHDGNTTSYAQLDEQANQLAQHLRAHGVHAESRVAVRLPRSAEVLVAALAIWKAGGAYVPIDPEDPPERQALLLEASGAVLLITRVDLGTDLHTDPCATPTASELHTVRLDADRAAIAAEPSHAPQQDTQAEQLAYVIFTSGSTGRPKGIAVTHGALLNHIAWVRSAFDLGPSDRFLLRTPLTFDASLWEMVHPLACGACLVVAPPQLQRDPAALLKLVAEARISVLQTVPSMLTSWLEEPRFASCAALRHLICAGEALHLELVHSFDRRCAEAGLNTQLHNLYGPSEACIDASWHSCRRGPDGLTENGGRETLPIGRPISNFQIHVLDATRQPAPVGVTGELYIGGAGLARGYLNEPELTAESFVENPFGPGRLYRTGDLGRHLGDGLLEYAGRRDHQVKVSGHRIELGEIEVALMAHEQVKEVAVITDGPDGHARLLAYLRCAPEAQLDDTELRAFLARRLPRHMLPAVFVRMKAMPLTASEKIDRIALPAPSSARGDAQHEAARPRDETERRLAALMAKLLDVDGVGIHEDFFALGGHSLLATRLAARVREAWSVEVPLLRFFETPTVAALASAVKEARSEGVASASDAFTPAPLRDHDELPLSFAQRRLWFLAQLEPEATLYNMPGAVRLNGELDAQALDRAFVGLLRRHSVLRTVFDQREGAPLGRLQPAPESVLGLRDLSALSSAEQDAELQSALRIEAAHRFDLARGPLLRAQLLKLGPAQHALVLNQHHVISDAWSLGLMVHELETAYLALRHGETPELPALSWQYADFARWQAAQLSGERLERLLAYWREALRDAPPTLELPTDRPRSTTPRHRGRTLRREVAPPLAERARELARAQDTTLFVVLLAAFNALLHRVTRSEDLVVATAVANRTRLETEALIGFFINTLPLRVELGGAPSFRELLRRTQLACQGAFAHQDLPFERLVDELVGTRDPSRPPLANVSFNLIAADDLRWRLGPLEVRSVDFDAGSSKLDLGVTLIEERDGLRAELEYDTDLFDEATLQRLWDAYEALLASALEDPEAALMRLGMLDASARARALQAAQGPSLTRSTHPSVAQLVAQHAARRPQAEALVDGALRLDYAALDARVQRLAVRLVAEGVGAGSLVGLCLPRGADLVVAQLAIWRAGGAWVPVRSSDPGLRRRELLAQVGAELLLTHARFAEDFADAVPRVLSIDTPGEESASADRADGFAPPESGQLAYVLFTSGSTGRPKAVEMSHGALSHHTAWSVEFLGFRDTDCVVQKIPVSFDAALLEILTPLAAGATLVIADDETVADPARLLALSAREGATILNAVPSLLSALLEHPRVVALDTLRLGFCGGERLSAELARRFQERCGVPLINLYGPTEACIDATAFRCPTELVDPVPIGRPIAGARAYIVGDHGALLPELVPGELLLAGRGLAQGYRGAAQASAASFIDDPFCPGERAYRTGDLVRRRADGELVYLGRLDEQLKLRGQRLEPGEVEAALLAHDTVRDAAVSCADGQRLVAHLVGDDTQVAELQRFVATRLPPAWVPTSWDFLDELPRTPHGKLDRRALETRELPSPATPGTTARTPDTDADRERPTSDLEREVVQIVASLLDRSHVDLSDDFFALGGHSLLAMQLLTQLNARFGVELPLREVFAGPTPAQMAHALGLLQRGESLDALESARRVDLRAEAELPDEVRPAHTVTASVSTSAPHEVLLSGATGYLGAYLVHEFLQHTRAQVHCLVRAHDAPAAMERLRLNLQRYELWDDSCASRLVALPGDLGLPQLGLAPEDFDRLAREVDLVIHSGASVNFFHDYHQLAPVNVGGTLELLRLACAQRPTPFHFVSTIGVLASPRAAAYVEIPEDVALDEFVDVEGGYEQSKWVAEQLVHEAGRRGLPVAIHRPGRITGHSQTGVGNVDDVGGRVLRGCLEIGSAPDLDAAVDMTPVDFVAAAIAHLALTRVADGRAYHLVNPQRVALNDVFDWARAEGFRVRSLPWEDWLAELGRTVATQPDSTLYPLLPLFAGEGADESDFAPDVRLPPLDCRNVLEDLDGSAIRCPSVDRAMMSRWLQDFARRGVLAKTTD